MTFSEAYKEMLKGKKIKRKGFKGYWFLNPETGVFTINLPNGKNIIYGKLGLLIQNITQSDWEIID